MSNNTGGHSRDSTQDGNTQTGSVIEFMFVDRGYLAASYPYPPTEVRHGKRYIATEGLPSDMEEFLQRGRHAYIINASANAYNCWIFVYLTKRGEYGEHFGGKINDYTHIEDRLNDLRKKNRGTVRSTAFGSRKEAIFLRASDADHEWSFRWKDLPFSCEMMIQDGMEQSGWKDHRTPVGGKKRERIQYYKSDLVENHHDDNTSRWQHNRAIERAPGCIRFLTLGKNDAWIIYGETWHIWDTDKSKFPKLLWEGLEMGKKCQWIINKVELSLFNEEEYVLVYDEGPVFYNIISSTFVDKFKRVVKEWADSKGVDVWYNEEVVPEKIRSDRTAQRHLVQDEDDESSISRERHPPLADDPIPDYAERAPNLFPTTRSESASGSNINEPESEPEPRRTTSQRRPTAGATEPGPNNRRRDSQRAGVLPRQRHNNNTNPAQDHSRGASDDSTPRRQRGSSAVKDVVDTLLRKFSPDKTNP